MFMAPGFSSKIRYWPVTLLGESNLFGVTAIVSISVAIIAAFIVLANRKTLFEQKPFNRKAFCPTCRKATVQLLHGYTEDGKLWKGHECTCKGFQCCSCKNLVDKQDDCCR